jgi:ABC-type nitrate/sulfonate/bicarbonate transport system ATPase subunit
MRTFMFERDIMLLDEPFGALDALTRALMQRWLLEVWEGARRTVLFITHDIEEAIFLGDRVLIMSARPGHIKIELQVPLPRPRQPDVVTSPPFVELKRTLLAAVEDESRKAFAVMDRQPAAEATAAR